MNDSNEYGNNEPDEVNGKPEVPDEVPDKPEIPDEADKSDGAEIPDTPGSTDTPDGAQVPDEADTPTEPDGFIPTQDMSHVGYGEYRAASVPTEPPKGSRVPLGITVLAVLLAILVTGMSTFVITRDKMKTAERQTVTTPDNVAKWADKLAELDGMVDQVYIGDVDYDEADRSIMLGYLAALGDPYAYYYTADEYKQMTDESNGSSQGIGVSVIYDKDTALMEIISVFPDSAAEKAGMMVGDLVAYVGKGDDRVYVAEYGYEQSIDLIRGEAGTTVDLTVLRGNEMKEIDFTIERGYFSEQSVMYHKYAPDPTVGVIKITGFEGVTPNQFTEAVTELTKDGVTRLIIDLRYNPGGDRVSICTILDYILPEGPLLRIKDADGNITVINESGEGHIDIPMVVVVNDGTASAAELFTAAMRDYDRAKVVGTTTYGKGCMQTFYRLSDGSYFKCTTAMYCPPYSDNYDGVGIVPDVEVELDEALREKNIYKITDEEDNQLAAAYELIK